MILGFGFRARSGKDTIATYLVNKYNFIQESFAYPLKEYIGRQILGFNDKQLYGSWKEIIDPEWGLTPRQMLQLAGTDALRNKVHQNIWVVPVKRKIKKHIQEDKSVVVSDVRFINEIEMIKNLGGKVIRVDRQNPEQIVGFEKHSSEIELENYNDWDYIIDNNKTFQDLYKQIDQLIYKIKNIGQDERR